MDLDTRRLRVFLVVARKLHFSRAAKLLHLSQPAPSQQIRGFERELHGHDCQPVLVRVAFQGQPHRELRRGPNQISPPARAELVGG